MFRPEWVTSSTVFLPDTGKFRRAWQDACNCNVSGLRCGECFLLPNDCVHRRDSSEATSIAVSSTLACSKQIISCVLLMSSLSIKSKTCCSGRNTRVIFRQYRPPIYKGLTRQTEIHKQTQRQTNKATDRQTDTKTNPLTIRNKGRRMWAGLVVSQYHKVDAVASIASAMKETSL